MTMYLPNPELDPTGAEPGEFIDGFIDGHDADEPGGRNGSGVGGRNPPREVPAMHLDAQIRLDITHRAEEYTAGLVDNYHGGRDDVRAVIHDLHHQANVIDASSDAVPRRSDGRRSTPCDLGGEPCGYTLVLCPIPEPQETGPQRNGRDSQDGRRRWRSPPPTRQA